MSLDPETRVAPTRPLYGIDEISVPTNAVLIFAHAAVKSGPLYIRSGATAIQWAYHLNTQATPTIGGEVVQILSASAGPMRITGQTAGLSTNKTGLLPNNRVPGWQNVGDRQAYSPNHELKAIVDWFREYMEHAGSSTRGNVRRDERAIEFKYPERNWNFYIQVTELTGFRYDKSVIAPEWAITAEIVSDNALDYFKGVTMSSFTDALISNTQILGQIGLSAFAGSGTETSNGAFGNTGDFGSNDPFLNPELTRDANAGKTMGDNFQKLVASWSSGGYNFTQGVFGALLDQGANPQSVDQIYQNLFGSDFIGGPVAGNSTVGSSVLGSPTSGPSSKGDIVLAINSAFEQAGIPGYLAVADAMVESGLNPDSRSPNDGGSGIDGVGLFQVHCPGGAADNSFVRTASSIDHTSAVTKNYPVGQQISDAVGWWSSAAKTFGTNLATATPEQLAAFAAYAQKPQDPTGYASKVNALLGAAQQAISSATQDTGGAAPRNPFPDGWKPNRLDMGFDGTFTNRIVAPVDGVITYAAKSFSNWGGYVQLKADSQISGLPTDTLYFAEGLQPTVSSGTRVKAGDTICTPAPSPYGNAYGTTPDGSGQIEWGCAQSGVVGQPTDPLAKAVSNPRDMVLSFASWCQNKCGLPGPTETSNAGSP